MRSRSRQQQQQQQQLAIFFSIRLSKLSFIVGLKPIIRHIFFFIFICLPSSSLIYLQSLIVIRLLVTSSIFRWSEVNFTNILCAAFTFISCAHSFLCLRFRFVLYWRKSTGAKAAWRTLMKLSPGVDFTTILGSAFSYEIIAHSFFCN